MKRLRDKSRRFCEVSSGCGRCLEPLSDPVRGTMTRNHGRFDRRRQAGVDPVAGQHEAVDRPFRSAGAAARRAPARRSSASREPPGSCDSVRGTRRRQRRAHFGERHRRSTPSLRHRHDRLGAARDQRQVRRVAADNRAAIEHPLEVAARQADQRLAASPRDRTTGSP